MRNYKTLGITTFIILILLTITIYKVNTLVLKQLDQAGTLQQPTVETLRQVKEVKLEPKVVEGVVIEGQPPPAVIMKDPPSPSIKSQENKKVIYEPSSDHIIMIQ